MSAAQMQTNSRIAINSTMRHLGSRQATSEPRDGLDQVGNSLQYKGNDQYQNDALLQVYELVATRFAGGHQVRPGIAHVIPTGPAEKQAYRQQKEQRAKHLDERLATRPELLIEDVDADMTVALQNPRGCPHEYERVGIKHGLLQRRGTDAEAIAQYHDECSTENQEQGQPGAGLAEQQVQPIDHAGKAQQGWGSIGHWYVLLIVKC